MLREDGPGGGSLDQVEAEDVCGRVAEILVNRGDITEECEQGQRRTRLVRPNPLEGFRHEGKVARIPGQDRFIDLHVRGTRLDERSDLLSDRGREIERERLFRSIVLVEGERGEGHGSGQDRFHGNLGVRLSKLPIVGEHRRLPSDRSPDDRLAVVRVRVEVAHQSVRLDGNEFSREVALAVVPGDLPVRDEIDADLILLTKDLSDRISLDGLELGFDDLASIEACDPPSQGLFFGGLSDPWVGPNDGRAHHTTILLRSGRSPMLRMG